ncbi:hypothetical protein B7P34_25555 [Streptosporangium nondiastaticum]|uniref:Uncharacterized protein n=1 Tax=Streptosporangium nondiastaticum TaxID=35764 RepID=A0A9X7JLZ0_9ACTN|nr:hypothetical protein [Streptosporangium nondiastaticum]PSJ25919.1 hypothetical protein B7P34_25555 [Streptosporangium nondiastaticum]
MDATSIRHDRFCYYADVRDGRSPERPKALWRTSAGTGTWEYWSTIDWAWRQAGERRVVTSAPAREDLVPLDEQDAERLQGDRQGWAEYWVSYTEEPGPRFIFHSVIRRRFSPEGVKCEFSNSHLLWKQTRILTDEAGEGWGIQAAREEADEVLHELKGRPGITELGESGPHSPRPFDSFRYFITGDDPEDPWGLWRLDADGQWQHFSALEWGWFPEFWGDDFTVVLGVKLENSPQKPAAAKNMTEIEAEHARKLEAKRDIWIADHWLYWLYDDKHANGEPPVGVARRRRDTRSWHDELFFGKGTWRGDTDLVRRFPDYRENTYPWIEKVDRVAAEQAIAELFGLTGVIEP